MYDPGRWHFIGRPSKGGHKFFYRHDLGGTLDRFNDGVVRIWVCDDSGVNPDRAEDGPLYVDVCDARPILQGHKDIFNVPCSNDRGDTCYFLADPEETLWLIKRLRVEGQRRIRIHPCSPRSEALAECFRITEGTEKGLGYGV